MMTAGRTVLGRVSTRRACVFTTSAFTSIVKVSRRRGLEVAGWEKIRRSSRATKGGAQKDMSGECVSDGKVEKFAISKGGKKKNRTRQNAPKRVAAREEKEGGSRDLKMSVEDVGRQLRLVIVPRLLVSK
jgi:hypothetical protein